MKVIVVYGAPCSGKSTFVRDSITNKDIAYDYDLLTRALKNTDEHSIDRDITDPIVKFFEWALLNKLKEGYDNMPKILYYSTRYPTDFVKEKFKGLKVEYKLIESTKEECLERLEKDDSRPDKEEWKKKIEEWFNKYGDEKRRQKLKLLMRVSQ